MSKYHENRSKHIREILCTKTVLRKKKLNTTSLQATRRSSVRLTPKIPNYIIDDLDYNIVRSKSSREIILLLLLITKLL